MQKDGNGSALRKLALLVMFALVLFGVGAVTPASASVTYDITVTPNSGSWSGSGTFTVSPSPSPTGNTLYDVAGTGSDAEGTVNGTLSVNLVLTSGANSLTTAGASGTACRIEFSNGVPDNNLQCTSLVSTTGAKGVAGGGTLTLDNTSGQLYVGSASTYNGVTLAYALVTPKPSTLLLWGTGLLALGAIFRKKPGVNPAI